MILEFTVENYRSFSGKKTLVLEADKALKECSESEYWLELLIESGYYADKAVLEHCTELKRLLIASLNTAKAKS